MNREPREYVNVVVTEQGLNFKENFHIVQNLNLLNPRLTNGMHTEKNYNPVKSVKQLIIIKIKKH